MKILAIIPARSGSVGVPNKNIKMLGGKPLIQYTSDIALKSKLFTKVIVSTDCEKIASISSSIGLDVPFIRPLNLSTNKTPSIDVVKHAIEFFQKKEIFFDAVCLLQVTTPIRDLQFLNKCITKFKNINCDSLLSVREVPHQFNPHWCFKLDDEGYLKIATGDKKIIPRRQELPKSFYRDGSIYLTRTKIILERNSFFGDKLIYEINNQEISLNIDTPEDWKKAEDIFKNMKN